MPRHPRRRGFTSHDAAHANAPLEPEGKEAIRHYGERLAEGTAQVTEDEEFARTCNNRRRPSTLEPEG